MRSVISCILSIYIHFFKLFISLHLALAVRKIKKIFHLLSKEYLSWNGVTLLSIKNN